MNKIDFELEENERLLAKLERKLKEGKKSKSKTIQEKKEPKKKETTETTTFDKNETPVVMFHPYVLEQYYKNFLNIDITKE